MDSGLENVVAAETVLSDVDGKAGRLIIRGWPVEELSARFGFEAALHMLWQPFFPELGSVADVQAQLGKARAAAFEHVGSIVGGQGILSSLRTGWSLLQDDESLEAAIALPAAAGVFLASAVRAARGLQPIAPDPDLPHAADVLRMMRGEAASPAEVKAFEAYLVTVSDHGLNASTFAARVIASTRAGLVSAALGGVSALKGPLHGGAPGPVLDMLDEIGEPSRAEAWIDAALARKARLMGFGHRVYRVRDPRADALKAAVARLPGTTGRIEFAEHIETAVLGKLAAKYPDRALETNVEFYTAILLEALEIPREAFTAVFAQGRCLGWVAHAREQIDEGRLVRPKSIYTGPVLEAA
ncbi:citrate synthase/methylcitrate synthase [Henriciella litoralis]|uniref:citrate synthase/methylcitrate synthase n=1 Tax=Henriciella litoralis TaxID=568102 RepID=UPI000A05780B|nr:citrate synthase/methylcitrate synthase [Henriciella litoralis]